MEENFELVKGVNRELWPVNRVLWPVNKVFWPVGLCSGQWIETWPVNRVLASEQSVLAGGPVFWPVNKMFWPVGLCSGQWTVCYGQWTCVLPTTSAVKYQTTWLPFTKTVTIVVITVRPQITRRSWYITKLGVLLHNEICYKTCLQYSP